MGHTGTTDGFDQRLLNQAIFHIEGEFAGALLRRAPAHPVGQARDIADFLDLNPLPLLRYGGRAVVGPLGNHTHLLYFMCLNHVSSFLRVDGGLNLSEKPYK